MTTNVIATLLDRKRLVIATGTSRCPKLLERLFEGPVDLVIRSAIQNPYFLQSVDETSAALYEA